jgi:hypothetical protein
MNTTVRVLASKIKINYEVILLIILGSLVAFSIIENFRFVKDDTGNIVPFHRFLTEMPTWRLLNFIASNEWLGYQPRSFFLTWWTQIGLIKLFGMDDLFGKLATYFAIFASIIHVTNSVLIFKLARMCKLDNFAQFWLASLYLFLPTACLSYMISNNWFFLLPLFFTLCFSYSLVSISTFGYRRFTTLFLLIICIMFSGEQLMAVPYFLLFVSSYTIYKDATISVKIKYQRFFQNIFLILSGLALYFIYVKIYAFSPSMVKFEGSLTTNVFDLPHLLTPDTINIIINYTRAVFSFILQFFNPVSSIFAQGTIAFSVQSICLASAATTVFFSWALMNKSLISKESHSTFGRIVFLIFLFFIGMLPMFFGAISGNRPGPDDRYLLIPSLILCTAIVCVTCMSIRYKALRLTFATLSIFFVSLLTFHINIDVWRNQRLIDERLWSVITDAINKNASYILTINNDLYHSHRGLQRPYLSAAWTDFQADWGVTPRIMYETGKEVRLIHNLALDCDSRLIAVGYWGDKMIATLNNVQVVYFNDGPTMQDTVKGTLELMSLETYLHSIEAKQIPNRIINCSDLNLK